MGEFRTGRSPCRTEGMASAGYAIGASQGFIYVRAEYPIAVQRLKIAIDQARDGDEARISSEPGFILTSICASAPGFVCGEETALMTSIEENRASKTAPSVPGTERTVWETIDPQ